MSNTRQRFIIIPTLLAAVSLLLPGCSGGGSGPGSQLLAGTLLDQNGNRLAAYRVVYDQNTQIATVTDSQGQFHIFIPDAAVTGKDTISVYNAAGILEDTEPLPVHFSNQRTFRVNLPTPPTPPVI